ncbi:hypothetical protein BDY19DRAFT_941075 [Irpex rosettiformis]|uniref:Uncharacterized protein n=1 Tax=Irpex rosettiformis TaxID=378272 RepID=A0ACB8U6F5_9APHY|nr:hypothetical protein BDY19DRAFT_941075 [Irpex rosettiformis]
MEARKEMSIFEIFQGSKDPSLHQFSVPPATRVLTDLIAAGGATVTIYSSIVIIRDSFQKGKLRSPNLNYIDRLVATYCSLSQPLERRLVLYY